MRQEHFVSRHREEWQQFELWLQERGAGPKSNPDDRRRAGALLRDEAMPDLYRRLCHHLSLARRRGYSPQVTDYLQDLMQRGHRVLYRPPRLRWGAIPAFLARRFPREVRAQWPCMLAALVLFAGPLVAFLVAAQLQPELAYSVLGHAQVAEMESMYNPANHADRLGRDSGTDVAMFGYYIYNNISIGFRTFASGLLAGIGTVIVLFFNGVVIGTVAGHLQQIGYGGPFWRFVCGHGAFELTAIVIAGGAGLQLGLALLAPGNRTRRDALITAGRSGGILATGVFVMLVIAAFIEAFWSSIASIPDPIKFGVAALLWLGVTLWLWRGGRGDDDAA